MDKTIGDVADRYTILSMKWAYCKDSKLRGHEDLFSDLQLHEDACNHVPKRLVLELMSHNARIWAMEGLLKDMKNLEDSGIIALKIRDENKLRNEKIEDINKWQFIRSHDNESRNSRSPKSSAAQSVADSWTSPTSPRG